MSNIAEVILAVTALATVLCGMIVLYKPPPLIKRIRHKEFEAEFHAPAPQVPVPAVGTVEAGIETPPETTATPAPGAATESNWFALLTSGEYGEGMRLLRVSLADETNEQIVAGRLAIGMYFGIDKTPGALADLESHAARYPSDSEVQYWLGKARHRVGDFDGALAAFQAAERSAANDNDLVFAAIAVSQELQRRDELARATAHIMDAVRRLREPEPLGRALAETADLLSACTPRDDVRVSAFRELALESRPSDTELLFRFAFAYGSDAAGFALRHYSSLLAREPDNEAALNNAGVAAGELKLGIRQVRLYRDAISKGNTLASANLAHLLMRHGFVDDARELLTQAQQSPDAHRNVLSALGESAATEDKEEERAATIESRVATIRRLRIKYAGSLVSPPETIQVAGYYEDAQGSIVLHSPADGTPNVVTGTMVRGMLEATISGYVENNALRITWKATEPPGSNPYLSLLGARSGHGLLILEGDLLMGYIADGVKELDPSSNTTFEELRLIRRSSPNA